MRDLPGPAVFALLGLLLLAPDLAVLNAADSDPPAAARPAAPRWPVTGGGPLRDGFSRSALPSRGELRWRTVLPGAGIFGSCPVVDGSGQIFTVTNDILTSTPLSLLSCLDSAGNLVWRVELNDEFDFQPVLLSTAVVLLFSRSKQLYAYTGNGIFLWRRQYSASPRIGDSEVWANYSAGLHQPTAVQPLPDRSGGVLIVDDSPALLRVDAAGNLLWQTELYGSCAAGPLLINDQIYLPACDGRLHVYRVSDGKEQSSLPVGGELLDYPAGQPGGGILAAVSGYASQRLVKLPFDGASGFDLDLAEQVQTPPAISLSSEYLLATGRAGSSNRQIPTRSEILAIDSKGKFRWSRDLACLPSGQLISDASGRVVFGTQDIGASGVYGLGPQHGVEWWVSLPGATTVFPIADGLIGVQVKSERSDADKNATLLLGLGN